MKTANLILLLVILACGCVSYGRKIDPAKVAQIKAGTTTRTQVIDLIGSPDQITSASSGQVIFNYMFVRATPNAATYVPIVGAFAGGANVQNEMVMVTFTNDVVGALTSSYGGNDSGIGANAASSASLPDTTNAKRPK